MSITIYGASDDLIEVEGDIREEFDGSGDANLLALSNGCIFRIVYEVDGCWRITPVVLTAGVEYSKEEAVGPDDDNYSDRLTIEGVSWVAHAVGYGS